MESIGVGAIDQGSTLQSTTRKSKQGTLYSHVPIPQNNEGMLPLRLSFTTITNIFGLHTKV
jgi:hypothetical protein